MLTFFSRNSLIVAFTALLLGTGVLSATPITKMLTIQVFVLCDDAGASCTSTGPAGDPYFGVETNQIWNQAGIGVQFQFAQFINSTLFSFLDDSSSDHRLNDLAALYGSHGASATIVDLFLVHNIAGVFGEGYFGAGGLGISMDDVLAFNGGIGRLDTIAHELGHNFGLVPLFLGGDAGAHSADPNELMASGTNRNVPTLLSQIAPTGSLDLLRADEIFLARQSTLLSDVIPEPGTWALMLSGGSAVIFIRRRRAAKSTLSA